MKYHPLLVFPLLLTLFTITAPLGAAPPLQSFDTGKTIISVRTSSQQGKTQIIANSYEGTLLAYDQTGKELWKNPLSGFMNRDVHCADLNADNRDEVLAANADGHLYCLDSNGKTLWKFRPTEAPMNAVTTVRHQEETLICCGGYDTNIYWLTAEGKLLKSIASSTYSKNKPWGKKKEKRLPPSPAHIANFIRPVTAPGGKTAVAIHGSNFSNSSFGIVYLFEPLADKPFHISPKLNPSAGDLRIVDLNNDGVSELLCGSTGMIQDAGVLWYDFATGTKSVLELNDLRRKLDGFGYRVAQSIALGDADSPWILTSFGSRLVLSKPDLNSDSAELIEVGYSFHDLQRDEHSGRFILASAQSGGSCIHLVDPTQPEWKKALTEFRPMGKLKKLLDNTERARSQLTAFMRPSHERKPKKVNFITPGLNDKLEEHALNLQKEYGSPVFFKNFYLSQAEDWDRNSLKNETYQKKRDRRRKYNLTHEQALGKILPNYDTSRSGVSFWGGHGNDPYMFRTETMKKVMDHGVKKQKDSVFIYPELENYDAPFGKVLNDHIYPLAKYARERNAKIYLRTKHSFWFSIIHKTLWAPIRRGEFADIFIPSMEETTSRIPDLSISGRVGIWASGAFDQWGSREARDNPSFDRLRQHSHQMVPNHFLRTQIYHLSLGATYQNNFAVDKDYFSILYDLIAKGALYVPNRNEIVSFNPVYLGMIEPDPLFLDQGNNVKWITFYNQEEELSNPMVFNRLNGTWPGAPVHQWDFSTFASGVKDRRVNFLPPTPSGLVLITPPQEGIFSDKNPPRGLLKNNLHPIYRNILQEFITNGRHYLSSDGSQTFPAKEYHSAVAQAIDTAAQNLPLTVSGDVAWTVAHTAPDRLRLTLIDGGYLNPDDREASITFHSVQPKSMTDLLSQETFDLSSKRSAQLTVPCGLFRFIDIQLSEALTPTP